MHLPPSRRVSPAVAKQLLNACPRGQDHLSLFEYMETVLYHPLIGYYMGDRKRVGRDRNTDFYTASSIRETFSRLVVASIRQLLGEDSSRYTFVEFGPETGSGILGGMEAHPFKSNVTVLPGSTLDIPALSIVFSNELFDAQPFRRFVFTSGCWREFGVRIDRDELQWILLPGQVHLEALPRSAAEGYVVDWPDGCHRLLTNIVRQPWSGLFIAFDYGMDSRTLLSARPQGTGRTYSRHRMGTDLLERPTEIDITHHVAWDLMEDILGSHGFTGVRLLRQEAFFMQFAQAEIQCIMETSPQGFAPEKQSLMELLHPGNMGHKFQVLFACRPQN